MSLESKLRSINEEQLKNCCDPRHQYMDVIVHFKNGETSYTPYSVFLVDFDKKEVYCVRKKGSGSVSFSNIRDVGILSNIPLEWSDE